MTSHSRRSSWLIARELTTRFLAWMAAAWAVLIVIVVAIEISIASFGTPTVSVFAYVLNAAPYWLLVLGIILVPMLRQYVANGVTRGAFCLGAGIAAAALATAAAAMVAVTLYAEGRWYAAAGWQNTIEAEHLFGSTERLGPMFAEVLMVFITHMFVGGTCGALFQRFGPWGAPAAVLSYVGAVSVEIGLGRGWASEIVRANMAGYTPSWIVAALVAVVVVAVLLPVSRRLLRDVPIVARST